MLLTKNGELWIGESATIITCQKQSQYPFKSALYVYIYFYYYYFILFFI